MGHILWHPTTCGTGPRAPFLLPNHFNIILLGRRPVLWRFLHGAWLSCGDAFKKSGNTTSVGYEPATSGIRLWRTKHEATQSALTAIWRSDLFCSFIKGRSPTLKSSQFNQPHKKQVNFDAHTKNQAISGPHSKQSQFRPLPQKTGQSIATLKISQFRPAHSRFRPPAQKQFIIDIDTKMKSNSIPHTKVKIISTPPLKSSQFDSHSKTKST